MRVKTTIGPNRRESAWDHSAAVDRIKYQCKREVPCAAFSRTTSPSEFPGLLIPRIEQVINNAAVTDRPAGSTNVSACIQRIREACLPTGSGNRASSSTGVTNLRLHRLNFHEHPRPVVWTSGRNQITIIIPTARPRHQPSTGPKPGPEPS